MEAYKICMDHFKFKLLETEKLFEERSVKEYLESLAKEVIEKFDNSDVSCPIKTLMGLRRNLEDEIRKLQRKALEEFKNRQSKDNQRILVFYNDSIKIFIETLEKNNHSLRVNVQQRQNRLSEFHNEAITYFTDEARRIRNTTLVDEYKQKLHEALKARVQEKLDELLRIDNEKKEQAIQAYTKTCVESYSSSIRNRIEKGSWTELELKCLHEELRDVSKIQFEQKCITIQVGPEMIARFLAVVDTEFEKLLKDFQEKEISMSKTLEMSWTEMCELYESSMKKKFPNDSRLDEEKILSFHNWMKADVISKFKALKTSKNEKLYKHFQVSLTEHIDDFYSGFLNTINLMNSHYAAEMKSQLQNQAKELEDEFEHKITAFPKAESVLKFKQMCTKLINNTLVHFKSNTDKVDNILVNQFEKQLRKTLTYLCDQEVKNRSYLEEIQNQQLPLAKIDCEQIYNAKMGNYLTASHTPNELYEFHHTLRIELLNKYKDFNDNNRKDLANHIDLCFQAYEPLNSMNISERKLIMGIDLGTTTCCVAVYRNNSVELIRDERGDYITPSYVAIIDGHPGPIIGKAALENSEVHLQRTVFDSKRLLGMSYNDKSVQKYIEHWPFDVMDHEDGLRIKIANNFYKPEEISSMILTHLKEVTSNLIGETITEAVITVPAEFNSSQRNATVEAGNLAGLTKVELLDEPNAAALAYFWKMNVLTPLTCLVFDFGGGTLDVSIVKYSNGSIDVVKTGGDKNLGGRNFDNNLVLYCFQKFKGSTGIDVVLNGRYSSSPALRSKYLSEYARLRSKVEEAKIQLSTHQNYEINLDGVQGFHTGTGEQEVQDLSIQITREEFENIPENQEIFKQVQQVLRETITSSKLEVSEIQRVLLVGGSSYIPKIKSIIAEYFPDESIINDEQTPNEMVARGAAIYAAQLSGGKIQQELGISLKETLPLSFGIGKLDGSVRKIIEKGQKLPAKGTYTFYRKKQDISLNRPVEVYEGDADNIAENHSVYRFYLDDFKCEVQNELEVRIKIAVSNNREFTISATVDGTTKKYFVNKGRGIPDSQKEFI